MPAWPLVDLFPELGAFAHRLPWHDDVQHCRLLARLVRHATRLESGCIVWGGAHNNVGYGRLNMRRFGAHCQFSVHVLAWRLANGQDIAHWQEIAHGCDCPPCFNPSHLKRERRPDNRRASAENTHWKRAVARAHARAAEMSRYLEEAS